jgi:hypothetical protein
VNDIVRFDRSWRSRTTVEPCDKATIDECVRSRHYLRKWPAVVVSRFVVRLDGVVVGCIVFALPPRQTFKRYGGLTWELARLWLDDCMPTNTETYCVAWALRWIRRNRKDVMAVVSYADPSVGHRGGIYVAGNWELDGMTDDERKSPRCDYVAGGIRYQRKSHVPPGMAIERVPRVSKHRFVMRLQVVSWLREYESLNDELAAAPLEQAEMPGLPRREAA